VTKVKDLKEARSLSETDFFAYIYSHDRPLHLITRGDPVRPFLGPLVEGPIIIARMYQICKWHLT